MGSSRAVESTGGQDDAWSSKQRTQFVPLFNLCWLWRPHVGLVRGILRQYKKKPVAANRGPRLGAVVCVVCSYLECVPYVGLLAVVPHAIAVIVMLHQWRKVIDAITHPAVTARFVCPLDITQERTIVVDASPEDVWERLRCWADSAGYTCTGPSPRRWLFRRGSNWEALYSPYVLTHAPLVNSAEVPLWSQSRLKARHDKCRPGRI